MVKKVVMMYGAVPMGLEILRRVAEEEFVGGKKYKRWLEKGRLFFFFVGKGGGEAGTE